MVLNEDQIKNRLWGSKDILALEPKPITFISDYSGAKSLSLFTTQLTYSMKISPKRRRELLKEWIQYLPTLDQVNNLWVLSRINQEFFDSICDMKNLEVLYIKWCAGKTIEGLVKLNKLKHLYLYMPMAKDIRVLSGLNKLITLHLGWLKNISDFSFLKNLVKLEGLEICGGLYKNQVIDDLEFIKHMRSLRYLTLIGTTIKSRSLDPVLKLKQLRLFMSGLNLPKKEYAKLKQLKMLDNDFLERAASHGK